MCAWLELDCLFWLTRSLPHCDSVLNGPCPPPLSCSSISICLSFSVPLFPPLSPALQNAQQTYVSETFAKWAAADARLVASLEAVSGRSQGECRASAG